jgi:hypothetical protein
LLRVAGSKRTDIEHDFLFRPMCLIATHDARILRALGEATLIKVTVVGRGDACIVLRLTRLQFRRKRIYQRLDWFKARIGIGVLCLKISDDPRVFAVAQPVVIIDAHAAEFFESLWHNRRHRCSWRARHCRLRRTERQPARKRNSASGGETQRETPSG